MCVCVSAVVVTLEPLVGAETYVNGKRITDGVALKQGDFFSVQFCVFISVVQNGKLVYCLLQYRLFSTYCLVLF